MRFVLGLLCLPVVACAAETPFVNSERDVKPYTVPSVFGTSAAGEVSRATWESGHRQRLLALFAAEVYGRSPTTRLATSHEVIEDRILPGGKIRRKQVKLTWTAAPGGSVKEMSSMVLMHFPANAQRAPIFVGLNYYGNASTTLADGIAHPTNWVKSSKEHGIVNNRATGKVRGSQRSRWPVEAIVEAGYGVATAYYGDFFADDADGGYRTSVQQLFAPGDRGPGADKWGAVATWGWGLCRMLDYLEKDPQADASRAAVIGHSRQGKAALWAAANDPRFSFVIANGSGAGGVALSKRLFGETVKMINDRFPHWFCLNYRKYNDREDAMPFDQHQLVALIAPRPFAVGDAAEDLWCDPRGEFLSLVQASPVFELYGAPPFRDIENYTTPLDLNRAQSEPGAKLFHHVRAGKHDITGEDWTRYLEIAKRVWK